MSGSPRAVCPILSSSSAFFSKKGLSLSGAVGEFLRHPKQFIGSRDASLREPQRSDPRNAKFSRDARPDLQKLRPIEFGARAPHAFTAGSPRVCRRHSPCYLLSSMTATVRDLDTTETTTIAPERHLVEWQPVSPSDRLLDTTELRKILSEIAKASSCLEVVVSYAPQGPEDRSLRLHQAYYLLLEHRVHTLTVVYRKADHWQKKQFERSLSGVVHCATTSKDRP